MLIIQEAHLRQLMSQLITAARTCRDHNGDVPVIKTVEEFTMRGSALAALSLIAGQPVDTNVPQFKEYRR